MPASKKHASDLRSSCPIAGALDLVGDRWTLLIVRDLLLGRQRYGEFAVSGERIPTNILAERLARLENCGVIVSEPYQQNPPRFSYKLTPRGLALKPVVIALGLWGAANIASTKIPAQVVARLSNA
jgi:DNA-binding HxlR family transcriptional regulator